MFARPPRGDFRRPAHSNFDLNMILHTDMCFPSSTVPQHYYHSRLDLCSHSYCDAFPDMKAGWLDALGSDHEEQGDFLPKFSVGATLVHTATRPENASEGSATDAI